MGIGKKGFSKVLHLPIKCIFVRFMNYMYWCTKNDKFQIVKNMHVPVSRVVLVSKQQEYFSQGWKETTVNDVIFIVLTFKISAFSFMKQFVYVCLVVNTVLPWLVIPVSNTRPYSSLCVCLANNNFVNRCTEICSSLCCRFGIWFVFILFCECSTVANLSV